MILDEFSGGYWWFCAGLGELNWTDEMSSLEIDIQEIPHRWDGQSWLSKECWERLEQPLTNATFLDQKWPFESFQVEHFWPSEAESRRTRRGFFHEGPAQILQTAATFLSLLRDLDRNVWHDWDSNCICCILKVKMLIFWPNYSAQLCSYFHAFCIFSVHRFFAVCLTKGDSKKPNPFNILSLMRTANNW